MKHIRYDHAMHMTLEERRALLIAASRVADFVYICEIGPTGNPSPIPVTNLNITFDEALDRFNEKCRVTIDIYDVHVKVSFCERDYEKPKIIAMCVLGLEWAGKLHELGFRPQTPGEYVDGNGMVQDRLREQHGNAA